MSVAIECYKCAVEFCLPDGYYNARRRDHKLFSCPNGHRQQFIGKSDVEKLRDQVASLRWQLSYANGREDTLLERLDHMEHVAWGYKGAMRKAQNEVRLVS